MSNYVRTIKPVFGGEEQADSGSKTKRIGVYFDGVTHGGSIAAGTPVVVIPDPTHGLVIVEAATKAVGFKVVVVEDAIAAAGLVWAVCQGETNAIVTPHANLEHGNEWLKLINAGDEFIYDGEHGIAGRSVNSSAILMVAMTAAEIAAGTNVIKKVYVVGDPAQIPAA
jgi:hypothetical protein